MQGRVADASGCRKQSPAGLGPSGLPSSRLQAIALRAPLARGWVRFLKEGRAEQRFQRSGFSRWDYVTALSLYAAVLVLLA